MVHGDRSLSGPDWLLDEGKSAGRENLDPLHVARYDDKEDAGAVAEVRLCESLGLSPDSTVIEFGSGTGQFTLAVARRCRRVIAVDVSGVMQDRLREKLAATEVEHVQPVQAGFLTYEHQGEPVDFVYSRFALHHLPDFWKVIALNRIHSLLRPGGILRLWDVVFSFEPAEAGERIEKWCSTGGSIVEADWTRAELAEHVRDEHSTFTWILETMADRCGFRIEAAEYSADGISAKYVLRRP